MTSIDTIRLTTHTDYIQGLDSSLFYTSEIDKNNGLKFKTYSLEKKPIGISKLTINDLNDEVNIKLSSKILGSNYKEGICLNTLDQLRYELNKLGIEFSQDFIQSCIVKYVDVKNDLELSKDVNQYITSLDFLNAPRFIKTKYDTSVVFHEKIKTNPIRFTGYSKYDEIQDNKNKAFYKSFPELPIQFENVLRIESRMPNGSTVKKHFGSNNLLQILNKADVNYEILNKVIDNQTKTKPLLNLSKMTNTQEKKLGQIYLLNDQYNGDFDSIYKHIKNKYGKNTKVTGLKREIKEMLAIISNSRKDYNQENIIEMMSALKQFN